MSHSKTNKAIDCEGDSGGPFMYFSNNIWTVYGIVSGSATIGSKCDYTAPSFYTQVPKYLDWIRRAVYYLSR